jgi:ABC-type branched-subunit amino acid transport system permease subunit
VETLRSLGYTAVVSDEAVEPDVMDLIETKLSAGFMAFLWVLAIVFVTMFLSLCSSKAMNATRGDVGIMRSMGIPTTVVKISIYVQTLLALIPAALITAGGCIAIFTIPKTNDIFPFLHGWDYVFIAVVMVLIALNLSRKYVGKMFNQSVKKTLRTEKGGSKS